MLTEEQLDALARLTLLGGSTLSFVIIAVGLAALSMGPFPTQTLARPPQDVLAAAVRLDSLALVNLGILVLMATPVLGVIVAILGFAMGRRWHFVGVSSLVLAMLLVSFFVAAR